MSQYSLKTILSTFTNKNGKKLTIFNAAKIGGISSLIIKIFFIAMPFMEYFAIFNPFVLDKIGFVSSIVVYIVFMSIIMMIIFLIVYMTRKSVIRKIAPSWETYFPGVDLSMVLAVGITPYSDFFKHYGEIVKEDLNEEELHTKLKKAFSQMQEENKELLIAIEKDNQNI